MSESVSPVDAILAGLRGKAFQLGTVVELADAEAAVHATAQKYQAALARQGAMLDRCRDERLSWEDVEQHVEDAVHATVREVETWLRTEAENPSDEGPAFWLANFNGYDGVNSKADARVTLAAAADLVARRFGGAE